MHFWNFAEQQYLGLKFILEIYLFISLFFLFLLSVVFIFLGRSTSGRVSTKTYITSTYHRHHLLPQKWIIKILTSKSYLSSLHRVKMGSRGNLTRYHYHNSLLIILLTLAVMSKNLCRACRGSFWNVLSCVFRCKKVVWGLEVWVML